MRLRPWLLAACLVAGCGGAATRPAPRFAMNVNGVFFEPPAVQQAALQDLHDLGIRIGRADTFWDGVEPRPGDLQWAGTDARVSELSRAGIRWQPIVDYSAPWVSADDKAPPRDPAPFAAFAAALARRYGRGGTFWRAHPALPALPVDAYEIWNEPNSAVFWHPAPDPAAYASLYAAARAALRRVDPHATVVTGGLFPDGAREFLAAMRAARPSLTIDAIGYHAYGATASAALAQLDAFVREAAALGLDRTPVWLTELGWPTTGDGALTEPARERAYRALLAGSARRDCAVAEWAPFTWMSTPAQRAGDRRVFDLREAHGPLPSARAYAAFAAAPIRACG